MEVKVFVPAWAIPDKYVDFRSENRQCAGARLNLRKNGELIFSIPPPPAGFFTALEMCKCGFFHDPFSCDIVEWGKAFFLLSACEKFGAETLNFADDADLLRREGDKICKKIFAKLIDSNTMLEISRFLRITPFEGFAMIPNDSPPKNGTWWFGAEFLAAITSIAGKRLAISPEMSIWKTPLALIGHVAAVAAIESGVKGVSRKPDEEEGKKVIKEAIEREMAGRLHPWQIVDPVAYPPSVLQCAKNPEIAKEWRKLLDEKE